MFRFTIRDVCWLTVVVRLGCAWWLDYRRLAKEVDALGWQVAVLKAKNVTPHGHGLIIEEDAARLFRAFAAPADPNP